jgi:hypothetical protein
VKRKFKLVRLVPLPCSVGAAAISLDHVDPHSRKPVLWAAAVLTSRLSFELATLASIILLLATLILNVEFSEFGGRVYLAILIVGLLIPAGARCAC